MPITVGGDGAKSSSNSRALIIDGERVKIEFGSAVSKSKNKIWLVVKGLGEGFRKWR